MSPAQPRTPDPPPGTAAASVSFAALRHRGFRVYFIASALAMMADSVEHVISYWMMFQEFHSHALAGFAVISHWVPFLLLSVPVGALADRVDPRRLIQLGMVLFMVASLGWGFFFLVGGLQTWHAAVLLTIHGLAGVLWGPPSQLLLHDMVGATQLQSAVRLLATSRWLGLLFGPAVGAGLLALLGPTHGILLNAAFYLPLILVLWKAPYGPRFRAAGAPAGRAVQGFRDLWSTARDIARDRTILSMTVLAGSSAVMIGSGYQAQMPAYATDLGHGDAGVFYSMLLAADAAGALTAAIVLEGRNLLPPQPRTAVVLAMLWCAAIGAFAATTVYPLALVLLFCAGFVSLAFNAMAQTLVQLHAPAPIRGRVIGFYNMSGLGLRAFSGLTVGLGGAVVGVHASLGLSAAALFAITLSLFAAMRRPVPVESAPTKPAPGD